MKPQALQIRFTEYDRLEELTETQANLVRKAIEAAGYAYAPYSSYHVGAAALLENGEIISGNNQENAAYPSGLCAERVAIFYAGSNFPDLAVTAIAIVAIQDEKIQDMPATPCGACRQVLCEKESQGAHPIEIILYGRKKIQIIQRASDLLPLPFVFGKRK